MYSLLNVSSNSCVPALLIYFAKNSLRAVEGKVKVVSRFQYLVCLLGILRQFELKTRPRKATLDPDMHWSNGGFGIVWVAFGCLLLKTSLAGVLSDLKQPRVVVEQGVLLGSNSKSELLNRNIACFFGIPYAKPPVGWLRFKEAEPAAPWPGILNATIPGPKCIQYSHFAQNTQYEVHGSEDCLYLNVFSPKIPQDGFSGDSNLMDVIVYIHGGAFMFLSGHQFGPEFLLDKDIVLVTLNYRLGPMGFMSTGDEVVPGNNGLKDQLLALKWVKKNIEKFGGDPNKITIAGTSAGGASVHFHVLSPKSKGLFSKGIVMSGAVLNPWPMTENSLEKAKKLALELGCSADDNAAMIECLRSRPAEQIVEKSKLFIPWLYSPFTPFGPVVEPQGPSAFIEKEPLEIIESGAASDVPLLFSYTADEGLYPGGQIIEDAALMKALKDHWPDLLPHLLDYNYTIAAERRREVAGKIESFYGLNQDFSAAALIKMIGERLFIVGIRESAKLHAELYQSRSLAYVFSFVGSRRGFMDDSIFVGVSHADDLAYLFKKDVPWGPIGNDTESKAMIRYMVDLWYKFIKNSIDYDEWNDLKSSLPGFGYVDIVSGRDKNDFKVDFSVGIENFWNSLNFQENGIHRNRHAEL